MDKKFSNIDGGAREMPNDSKLPGRRWLLIRHVLASPAGVVLLLLLAVVLFYGIEDWRGKRAWEQCKRELEAAGEHLDWKYLIPPEVADAENFFAAPKMQEWFQKKPGNELNPAALPFMPDKNRKWDALKGKEPFVHSPSGTDYPASVVLEWAEQNREHFQIFFEACKRPKSRLIGSYRRPIDFPIPNFVNMRQMAQTLTTCAKARIFKGQSEKAFEEMSGIARLADALSAEPSLISGMMRVGVVSWYTEVARDGLVSAVWNDDQVRRIEEQLAAMKLVSSVEHSLRADLAWIISVMDVVTPYEYLVGDASQRPLGDRLRELPLRLMPRGWKDQNKIVIARLMAKSWAGLDTNLQTMHLDKLADYSRELDSVRSTSSLTFNPWIIPTTTKSMKRLAIEQTQVSFALLACALERYRRANGSYPEALDQLVPQFIAAIPPDVIDAGPVRYTRIANDKFLLYSVGYNETDEGGGTNDWVWPKADWWGEEN